MASSPLCSVRIALIQGPLGHAKDLRGAEGGAHPTFARPKHLTVSPSSVSLCSPSNTREGEGVRSAPKRRACCPPHARALACGDARECVRARLCVVCVCMCVCLRECGVFARARVCKTLELNWAVSTPKLFFT